MTDVSAGRCGSWNVSHRVGQRAARPRASSGVERHRAARARARASRRRAAPTTRGRPRPRGSHVRDDLGHLGSASSDLDSLTGSRLTGSASRRGRRGSTWRPAALSGGSRSQMSSASTAAWTAIWPGSASASTDGAPMLGSSVADRRQIFLGGVHHHVAAAARGDDAFEHQLEPLDELAPLPSSASAVRDQHRLATRAAGRCAGGRSRSPSTRWRRGRRSRPRARAAAPPRPSRRS